MTARYIIRPSHIGSECYVMIDTHTGGRAAVRLSEGRKIAARLNREERAKKPVTKGER